MKILSWLLPFATAAIVNTVLDSLDIAYSLAKLLYADDKDMTAIFTGLFAGIIAVVCYGLAFFFGKKLSKHIDVIQFRRAAKKAGMSEFDYAKSITPEKVISFCERNIDGPIHIITDKLNQMPDLKITSRPCADALIEGYTKIMENRKVVPDVYDPDVHVDWRDQ